MDSRSFVEAIDFYYKHEQYNSEIETMANLSDYKIYKMLFLLVKKKFSRKFAVVRLISLFS